MIFYYFYTNENLQVFAVCFSLAAFLERKKNKQKKNMSLNLEVLI